MTDQATMTDQVTMTESELESLTTEARLPGSTDLDCLSSLQIVQLMNDEDRKLADLVALQAPVIARAIDRIVVALQQGGRLIYGGAGTSGRLGLIDAAECGPTFGSSKDQVDALLAGGPGAFMQAVEGAEDDHEQAVRDLLALFPGPNDVVVGITASGRTPYVLGFLKTARERGAGCIAITCNDPSEVAQCADLLIPLVVGPEVLSGSTRLKAGTATKMVLNMLSTGAFVRLGKTFGNLMVDLKPGNEKLRARCVHILCLATGLPAEDAAERLKVCDGDVKVALVATTLKIDPEQARLLLVASAGHVRSAIDSA